MSSYKSALKKISKNRLIIKNEIVVLKKCLNRISAFNIFSPSDYPASNNTAFDGFAVNSKETDFLSKKKVKNLKLLEPLPQEIIQTLKE